MRLVERKYRQWLELVDSLIKRPAETLPRRLITCELALTFDTHASWNGVDANGDLAFEMPDPPPGWPDADELQFWREAMSLHPLVRWFAATGSSAAMTTGRVPTALVSARGVALLREHLEPVTQEHQLSMPYQLDESGQRSFILARGGTDFGDEDLELARRIQPLLGLLAHQGQLLHGMASEACNDLGLTGREAAVVRLLAEGLTAGAMGHRLGCSTRTVEKHLEHVYRKLGVRDRLLAVRVAGDLGLLSKAQ